MELHDGEWEQYEPMLPGKLVEVGVLPNATERGKPGVMLRIELDDGRTVFAQTTYNLFQTAAMAFRARWGDPSD